MSKNFPQLRELHGRKMLFVDDEPFIILSLQWDCDGCFSKDIMEPLFPELPKMGCNSSAMPLYWKEVEPEEGKFYLELLKYRIDRSRELGLKIVLLWFGSFKNSCMQYCPDWVKENIGRFPRARTRDGRVLKNYCCPNAQNTLEADRRALTMVFKFLKEYDTDHTVILFQIENEVGTNYTARCFCPVCNEQFEREGWSGRYGAYADEAMNAYNIARFCDSLAGTVKSIKPLPVYLNAALIPPWSKKYPVAGQCNGFNGGPSHRMLEVWRETTEHIDFIAPDIYAHSYRDFHRYAKDYSWKDNPLYVAEHSSGDTSRADKNAYYAIGQYAAIGFDPWAIDRNYPDEYITQPYISAIDRRWSKGACQLRDAYQAIGKAMVPIALAQNTENIMTVVQEPAETDAWQSFGDVDVLVRYFLKDESGKGFVIRTKANEFIAIGTGYTIQFLSPLGEPIDIIARERGFFRGKEWVYLADIRSENEYPPNPCTINESWAVKLRIKT